MFGKILNNFYYGKSGKGDYRRDDLPKNRWQLFWEMLRIRLSGLFRMNLMTMLAYLPMMYVAVAMVNSLFSHLVEISTTMADPVKADTLQELVLQSPQYVYSIVFSGFMLLIPFIAITGPVQAGLAYVTRNWARDEHAFVWSDFKDAIKENWKQALGVSAITGFVPIVMLVCYQFYGSMADSNGLFFIIPQMLTLALGLVWLLSITFMYPMLVTYRMSFGVLIKNSMLLAVGRLPQTVGVRLLMLAPTALAVLVAYLTPYMLYALMALCGYYILIGNALARFVYASFTNGVFDKYINPRIAGVEVDRGLAQPEDEDDDMGNHETDYHHEEEFSK